MPARLPRLDRLADDRIVFHVSSVAPDDAVTVRKARKQLAVRREPSDMDGPGLCLLPRLGFDPSLGQQLRVQRIADRAVDVLHVALANVRNHVVRGVISPVLRHGRLDRMLDAG